MTTYTSNSQVEVAWTSETLVCNCCITQGSNSETTNFIYKGISKSFWTGHLQRELQVVQLSATTCNCITII